MKRPLSRYELIREGRQVEHELGGYLRDVAMAIAACALAWWLLEAGLL